MRIWCQNLDEIIMNKQEKVKKCMGEERVANLDTNVIFHKKQVETTRGKLGIQNQEFEWNCNEQEDIEKSYEGRCGNTTSGTWMKL